MNFKCLFSKKNFLIITVILVVLIFGENLLALGKNNVTTNGVVKTTVLQWKFIKYTKEASYGMEFPCTDVSVIVNHKNEIKIASIIGDAVSLEITNDGQFPKNTIMACSSWYAGSGCDICISRISNDTLVVFEREKEEATETDEKLVTGFKELKRIAIPKDSKVEIEKIIEK